MTSEIRTLCAEAEELLRGLGEYLEATDAFKLGPDAARNAASGTHRLKAHRVMRRLPQIVTILRRASAAQEHTSSAGDGWRYFSSPETIRDGDEFLDTSCMSGGWKPSRDVGCSVPHGMIYRRRVHREEGIPQADFLTDDEADCDRSSAKSLGIEGGSRVESTIVGANRQPVEEQAEPRHDSGACRGAGHGEAPPAARPSSRRVTMSFDLPQEETEFLESFHGPEHLSRLREIDEQLRMWLKHNPPADEANRRFLEDLRNAIGPVHE